MPEKIYVELSDGRKGWYIVTEERPDGSLVVVPDKSDPRISLPPREDRQQIPSR